MISVILFIRCILILILVFADMHVATGTMRMMCSSQWCSHKNGKSHKLWVHFLFIYFFFTSELLEYEILNEADAEWMLLINRKKKPDRMPFAKCDAQNPVFSFSRILPYTSLFILMRVDQHGWIIELGSFIASDDSFLGFLEIDFVLDGCYITFSAGCVLYSLSKYLDHINHSRFDKIFILNFLNVAIWDREHWTDFLFQGLATSRILGELVKLALPNGIYIKRNYAETSHKFFYFVR